MGKGTDHAPQYKMNGNIRFEFTISTPGAASQATWSATWARNGMRPSSGGRRGRFCFRRAVMTFA